MGARENRTRYEPILFAPNLPNFKAQFTRIISTMIRALGRAFPSSLFIPLLTIRHGTRIISVRFVEAYFTIVSYCFLHLSNKIAASLYRRTFILSNIGSLAAHSTYTMLHCSRLTVVRFARRYLPILSNIVCGRAALVARIDLTTRARKL